MIEPIEATAEGWREPGLSPLDIDAIALGIVEDVEQNNGILSTRDKMLRCARLGIIYRDYKELTR